jgi:ribosomal protein S12 methylthiotransferase
VREERQARFMEVQARISAARLARKVGQTIKVLIDSVEGTKAIGRSAADAPEIDGQVHVSKARGVRPGDFIDVKVTRADEHDLYGVRIGQ